MKEFTHMSDSEIVSSGAAVHNLILASPSLVFLNSRSPPPPLALLHTTVIILKNDYLFTWKNPKRALTIDISEFVD